MMEKGGQAVATQLISTTAAPDYRDESRYDRIDGQWVQRPVPNDHHSDVQFNIAVILKALAASYEGMAVRQEWSLAQPETVESDDPNYMTPDVLVSLPGSSQRSKRGHLVPPALLAVEIASPGQIDLIQKAQILYSWGVAHCWIINPETKSCLEYHGGDKLIIAGDVLHANPLTLPVADIFRDCDGS